jgi:hypothetical protein
VTAPSNRSRVLDKLENPTQNYTVVPNEVFDLEVSAGAKFLYIYLLSRPDNWTIRANNIADTCGVGRQKSYNLLGELKSANILEYNRVKDGGGVYTLHKITTSSKATSGKATSGISSDIVSKERAVNTERTPTLVQSEFERWWSFYPIKKGKKPALTIWKRIKPDTDALIADTKTRAKKDDGWIRGYAPNPTTYLNQERWNDELTQPKQTNGFQQPEVFSQAHQPADFSGKAEAMLDPVDPYADLK